MEKQKLNSWVDGKEYGEVEIDKGIVRVFLTTQDEPICLVEANLEVFVNALSVFCQRQDEIAARIARQSNQIIVKTYYPDGRMALETKEVNT